MKKVQLDVFTLCRKLQQKMIAGIFISVLFLLTSCAVHNDPVIIYTVTFDADGGTPVPSAQKVEEGSTVSAPSTNPTKAGYVFVYWHLDGSTTAYNFQTSVSRDITLYAKWQEEAKAEYWQVTWELNGGSWPPGDNHATQVLKGGTLAEPAEPVKSGSTFEGWYKETALTNKITFPYDVSNITANFTLYTKWTTEEEPKNNETAIVASGKYNYFVLKADGSLHTLGRNNYGQLGTGSKTDVEILTQVATGVVAVSAKEELAFIVKQDGSILGAGYGRYGGLGLGNTDNCLDFTVLPVNNVKTVAVGYEGTLLLKNDGSVWGTGNNYYGQLGTGDEINKTSFTATNITSDAISISSSSHSLVLKKDGTVWGAGANGDGVLGKTTSIMNSSFVQIFSGAKAIAAGIVHSLVLANDGMVYATGINKDGQLGVGNVMLTKEFTPVVDNSGAILTNVTAISAGYYHSLALKTDGTLWATGFNNYGQLGTGDENNRYRFTKIATGVALMSAGESHTVFIKDDGTIVTYGHVNPYDVLKGSGQIIVKVNDNVYGQYITGAYLFDKQETLLARADENITSAHSGWKINVKPGSYNMEFKASNSAVWHNFPNLSVSDNETVTITYEYVSTGLGSYRWTVARSSK